MTLNSRQRAHLRKLGHGLAPSLMVGKAGITPTLMQHLDSLLEYSELVKVRVGRNAPEDPKAVADALSSGTGAEIVGRQGHVCLLFRPSSERPTIVLPGATGEASES